jgi:hypothetical protein
MRNSSVNLRRMACLLVLIGVPGAALHAQSLSMSVAALKTSYSSGQYNDTRGDWNADAVLRLGTWSPLHVGLGVSVGKFDESYSDPSFTAVGAFLEPSVGAVLSENWGGTFALRYGLQQERVGERSDGLWAWGWQAGAVATIDYHLSEETAIGLQLEATRLDLRHDADLPLPPSGVDRVGWRFGAGAVLRFPVLRFLAR